jgi:DNA invertase Pin-like site-specific DNA recombinase
MVENQLKECREYVYKLTQKGDEVVEYCEPETSTFKPMRNRKKLVEMMSRLRQGDLLVVYKVDRLARDKQELINIYCDIRKKGVDIYGLYDPSLNEESICIYAFMACTERKNIQVRTLSGMNRKRANGERVGGTLYGYSLDETKLQMLRVEAHSYNKPYLLIPNEAERAQVNLMVEWHNQGLSYGQIACELDAKGFRNRKGNPVHKMTVYRILKRLGKLNPTPRAEVFG